jgi:hypothetical protein
MRMISARGDRGMLPDYQALLAATLADLGKIDEAERLALESLTNASPDDTACRVAATTALAAVRAAQNRDEEAEELFGEALALTAGGGLAAWELEPLERLTNFLRDRGREDDAAPYEERLAALSPPPPTSTARIA